MSREQNVPLLLWISTAILAHIATGGGADQVARIIEDRSELQSFARSIRGEAAAFPEHRNRVRERSGAADRRAPSRAAGPESGRDRREKKREKKPELAKVKPPEKKAEPKKIVLPTMVSPAPPPPPQQPPPPTDHRIAVKQHAAPDQEDNPTAHFIADEANHVKEESVAQITAHDRDEKNPTPGGHHAGAHGSTWQRRANESRRQRGPSPATRPTRRARTRARPTPITRSKGIAAVTQGDSQQEPRAGPRTESQALRHARARAARRAARAPCQSRRRGTSGIRHGGIRKRRLSAWTRCGRAPKARSKGRRAQALAQTHPELAARDARARRHTDAERHQLEPHARSRWSPWSAKTS